MNERIPSCSEYQSDQREQLENPRRPDRFLPEAGDRMRKTLFFEYHTQIIYVFGCSSKRLGLGPIYKSSNANQIRQRLAIACVKQLMLTYLCLYQTVFIKNKNVKNV